MGVSRLAVVLASCKEWQSEHDRRCAPSPSASAQFRIHSCPTQPSTAPAYTHAATHHLRPLYVRNLLHDVPPHDSVSFAVVEGPSHPVVGRRWLGVRFPVERHPVLLAHVRVEDISRVCHPVSLIAASHCESYVLWVLGIGHRRCNKTSKFCSTASASGGRATGRACAAAPHLYRQFLAALPQLLTRSESANHGCARPETSRPARRSCMWPAADADIRVGTVTGPAAVHHHDAQLPRDHGKLTVSPEAAIQHSLTSTRGNGIHVHRYRSMIIQHESSVIGG